MVSGVAGGVLAVVVDEVEPQAGKLYYVVRVEAECKTQRLLALAHLFDDLVGWHWFLRLAYETPSVWERVTVGTDRIHW